MIVDPMCSVELSDEKKLCFRFHFLYNLLLCVHWNAVSDDFVFNFLLEWKSAPNDPLFRVLLEWNALSDDPLLDANF